MLLVLIFVFCFPSLEEFSLLIKNQITVVDTLMRFPTEPFIRSPVAFLASNLVILAGQLV